jgi:hypothetical protein
MNPLMRIGLRRGVVRSPNSSRHQRRRIVSVTQRTTTLLTAVALTLMSGLVAAHPGHGEKKMLSGRIVAIEPAKIQMEVFDQASFSTQRVWVVVDDKTTVRSGKARLKVEDLRNGQEVECAAETDEGPDGASLLLAITFRVKPAKQ